MHLPPRHVHTRTQVYKIKKSPYILIIQRPWYSVPSLALCLGEVSSGDTEIVEGEEQEGCGKTDLNAGSDPDGCACANLMAKRVSQNRHNCFIS